MRLQILSTVALALAGVIGTAGCENVVTETAVYSQASARLDRSRGRVWSLVPGGVAVREARSSKTVILELPGWILAGPADACPPDLALGPKGEVVVTSNVIPTLWRIDPETLAVSVHPVALEADGGRDIGFTSLVYSVPHGAFFAVSHAHGAVWKINSTLTIGQKVQSASQSTPASERKLSCATT